MTVDWERALRGRDACIRFYLRYPATVTLALSTLLLIATWWSIFFGGLVAPYDYQTADYPGYIEGLRAVRYSPFCLFNPFSDGGVLSSNLIARYDPIEWLPIPVSAIPGYAALQSAFLAHLILVPVGLLLVAWANDVPRARWILVAAVAQVAYASGPTLKYFQQTNAMAACSLYVLIFGLLEAHRRFGGLRFALPAGLAFAYANAHWVYATVFFPIVLGAYVLANARELLGTRRRFAELAAGAAVAIVVTAPAYLLDVKYNHVIEISRHLTAMVQEVSLRQIPAMLGAPLTGLALVALPTALIVLVAVGLRHSKPLERWLYSAALIVLVLYAFADALPLGPLFRALYPLAGVIRRPYAAWYVIMPFAFFLAVRGLRAPAPLTIRAGAAVGALATGFALWQGSDWLSCGLVLVTLAAIAMRPTLSLVAVAGVAQWAIVAWIPFWHSPWQPVPIAPAGRYLAPYESVRAYLPFEVDDSLRAYRVANIGLPAEFGPSAGAWEIYGSAADYNTSIPHELVQLLGTRDLHATVLGGYLAANPQQFADKNWERLGVRYYIMAPSALAALPRAALAKPNLRVLDAPGYWNVVEDTNAAPFVGARLGDGSVIPVAARMTRDSFDFTVPPGAAAVRFANIYDAWWRVHDEAGRTIATVADAGGQLELDARPLAGRRIHMVYTDQTVVWAIGLSMALQTSLAFGAAALVIVSLRRGSRHATSLPIERPITSEAR